MTPRKPDKKNFLDTREHDQEEMMSDDNDSDLEYKDEKWNHKQNLLPRTRNKNKTKLPPHWGGGMFVLSQDLTNLERKERNNIQLG